MSDLASFFVASYLLIGPDVGKSEVASAWYKQSGAEAMVQQATEQRLSAEERRLIGNGLLIVNGIINQKVTFKWYF